MIIKCLISSLIRWMQYLLQFPVQTMKIGCLFVKWKCFTWFSMQRAGSLLLFFLCHSVCIFFKPIEFATSISEYIWICSLRKCKLTKFHSQNWHGNANRQIKLERAVHLMVSIRPPVADEQMDTCVKTTNKMQRAQDNFIWALWHSKCRFDGA